jgi:hypothetical protein
VFRVWPGEERYQRRAEQLWVPVVCYVRCTADIYCVLWYDISGFVYVRILWGEYGAYFFIVSCTYMHI